MISKNYFVYLNNFLSLKIKKCSKNITMIPAIETNIENSLVELKI